MTDRIKQKFGLVWPLHVKNFTEFLIKAREAFDGDLDMMLVLAVIGERTFSAANADPEQDYVSWNRDPSSPIDVEDINLRSIADYSGIPRETVRRKIAQLIERGWIERGPRNTLKATIQARIDLEPLTEGGIKYLEQMKRLFDTI